MSGSRIYLDTNVFVLAFEGARDDPLARALIDLFAGSAVNGGKPPLTTSEITLAEILVHPYRELNESRILDYERLLTTSEWLEVGPATRNVLSGAALLRARYRIKLPDAIHLSTALHFRCDYFMTGDRGIEGTYQLRYNASGRLWDSDPVEVVRLDQGAVARMIAELRQ